MGGNNRSNFVEDISISIFTAPATLWVQILPQAQSVFGVDPCGLFL